MTREQAIAKILTYTSAGEVSTAVWEAMGWPFEGFLRFSQFKRETADEALRKLQDKIRGAATDPTPKPCVLKLEVDPDPCSPDDWDDTSAFLQADSRHLRVGFGQRQKHMNPEEYWRFHVDIYSHSGISLRFSGGPVDWDTTRGRAAVYVSKEEFPEQKEAHRVAEGILEMWNTYLSGNMYMFTVESADGEVLEGPIGGFYGEEDARQEGEAVLKFWNEKAGF